MAYIFQSFYPKKNANAPKNLFMTEHCILKATNVTESWKLYTSAAGGAGGIYNVSTWLGFTLG